MCVTALKIVENTFCTFKRAVRLVKQACGLVRALMVLSFRKLKNYFWDAKVTTLGDLSNLVPRSPENVQSPDVGTNKKVSQPYLLEQKTQRLTESE